MTTPARSNTPNIVPTRGLVNATQRDLARLERQTIVRTALVQAEGIVQTEKLHEIDHLAREAMSGHAMLRGWADTLAAGDPLLADELKIFTDAARLGKAEVIADTIDSFCRESRR